MFASLLAAICDYIKESQLLGLKDEINNQTVTVFRGTHGTAISVPIRDMVVGDIVQINPGDRVPADCIILDEINLVVDQSIYSRRPGSRFLDKAESHVVTDELGQQVGDNHKANPDNILLSNTKIMRGEARAVVCAVGDHTLLSRGRTKE